MKAKKVVAILTFLIWLFTLSFYIIDGYIIKHQPTINIKQNNEDIESVQPNTTELIDLKLEEIKKLASENTDLYGWITINDTKIDYPVMYTQSDFYLKKDFYKKNSSAGTLFIDKHNNLNPRDVNLIIHGHNMKNGSMFANLMKYKKKDFYDNHKNITFYTLEEKQEYEIISVFLDNVRSEEDSSLKYYNFYGEKSDEEYLKFIENIKKKSLYKIEFLIEPQNQLLTLSTCEYSQKEGRLVVVARRIS